MESAQFKILTRCLNSSYVLYVSHNSSNVPICTWFDLCALFLLWNWKIGNCNFQTRWLLVHLLNVTLSFTQSSRAFHYFQKKYFQIIICKGFNHKTKNVYYLWSTFPSWASLTKILPIRFYLNCSSRLHHLVLLS